MADGSLDAEGWGARFAGKRGLYVAFADRLEGLLATLLAAEGIEPVQVTSRAKEVESFTEKIRRKDGTYDDPLRDMTDLAGARVVLYYGSEVKEVGKLIEREFEIDRENSLLAEDRLVLDRLGYASDHYIISVSKRRHRLAEWKPYAGLRAEIQVRTAVQHAWAAIDHKLNYKNDKDLPRGVRRRLLRVSALLEVADDEFEAVRVAREEVAEQYEEQVQSGDLDIEIDSASVASYVDNAPIAREWIHEARTIGFRIDDEEWDREDLSLLVRAARLAGFETIADLDGFLRSAQPWGTKVLELTAEPTGIAYDSFIIAVLVMAGSQLDFARLQESAHYDQSFADAIVAARAIVSDCH